MNARQELIDKASGYFLVKDEVSRNIREGRQTQHRKPIKLDLVRNVDEDRNDKTYAYIECADQQYHHLVEFAPWRVGQIIYLREAWFRSTIRQEEAFMPGDVLFRADGWEDVSWRPSIHMPKDYARTFVSVKRVWAERINNISCNDIEAESVVDSGLFSAYDAIADEGYPIDDTLEISSIIRKEFGEFWNSLYPGSWDRNEWVWACEFEVVPC